LNADGGLAGTLIAEIVLTTVFLAMTAALFNLYVPRCPECGSVWTTHLSMGLPIWICDRCQNVWRVRWTD